MKFYTDFQEGRGHSNNSAVVGRYAVILKTQGELKPAMFLIDEHEAGDLVLYGREVGIKYEWVDTIEAKNKWDAQRTARERHGVVYLRESMIDRRMRINRFLGHNSLTVRKGKLSPKMQERVSHAEKRRMRHGKN